MIGYQENLVSYLFDSEVRKFASVVELVDTPVLGTGAYACRFESYHRYRGYLNLH